MREIVVTRELTEGCVNRVDAQRDV